MPPRTHEAIDLFCQQRIASPRVCAQGLSEMLWDFFLQEVAQVINSFSWIVVPPGRYKSTTLRQCIKYRDMSLLLQEHLYMFEVIHFYLNPRSERNKTYIIYYATNN